MSCLICERNALARSGDNPYLVCELETGYVVLGDVQFFRGYTLFLCKQHVGELHELDESYRHRFLIDMSVVAGAVFRAFAPRKLNYEMLGNSEPHLHWHLFPRYEDDPSPRMPIWTIPGVYDDCHRPAPARLKEDIERLRAELQTGY